MTETTTQVVKYDITEAALTELETKYKDVPDAQTKDGYDEIREALAVIVTTRTDIEKQRKLLKKDALEYGRLVDSEAKRITTRIQGVEAPLRDAKNMVDNRAALAEEKEFERISVIQEKITDIVGMKEGLLGADAVTINARLEQVEALAIHVDTYAEFTEEAEDEKQGVLTILKSAYANSLIIEEAEKHRVTIEDIAEVARAEIDADLKRLEAITTKERSDIEKLEAYAEALMGVPVPPVQCEECKEELQIARVALHKILQRLYTRAKELKPKVMPI